MDILFLFLYPLLVWFLIGSLKYYKKKELLDREILNNNREMVEKLNEIIRVLEKNNPNI